jgi:hypothetical protein
MRTGELCHHVQGRGVIAYKAYLSSTQRKTS